MATSGVFGFCIYCGETTPENLTDEHAIPDALAGNKVLRKACCIDCQKTINPFEQRFLRQTLGLLRAFADLPRQRKAKRPPVQPTLRGEQVPINSVKIPLVMVSPRHRPVWEEGKLRSDIAASPDRVFFASATGYSVPDAEQNTTFRIDDTYRSIAKIAYSLSFFNFGFQFRKSEILEYILEGEGDFRLMLGGGEGCGDGEKLHSWGYSTFFGAGKGYMASRKFLKCRLSLFSTSQHIDYHVVVRDITDEPWVEARVPFLQKWPKISPPVATGVTIVPGASFEAKKSYYVDLSKVISSSQQP